MFSTLLMMRIVFDASPQNLADVRDVAALSDETRGDEVHLRAVPYKAMSGWS